MFFAKFSIIYSILLILSSLDESSADYEDDYDDTESRRSATCDCPHQSFGDEYEHAEIKKPELKGCEYQHCVFQIEPGNETGLALTIESIVLSSRDIVRIYQYLTVNDTEHELLHCSEVRSLHEKSIFTAAVGVGFRIHSYSYKRYYSIASFTFSFDRVGQDVKTCPYPLLTASPDFNEIPAIDRPGVVSCPFRLMPSSPERKVYLVFNQLKGVVFDQKGEEQRFVKRISTSDSRLVSTTYSMDFLLTRSNIYEPSSFNISYKEFVVDPCYCEKTELYIEGTSTYVTSPGFPDLYCSNFRCRRKFLHNSTLYDDMSLTFVVTIYYLNTDKHDYLDFFTDGIFLDRFNGTHEDVRLITAGDMLETEFVSDRSITRHGYNMSIQSVWMPIECVCPHKGMKVMRSQGTIQMDIPAHCTMMYCKWQIPYSYEQSQFTAMFNFSSEFDSITVITGSDVRRFTTITGRQLKRHWKRVERTTTTVLYQRALPQNYSLGSKIASFTVKWMGTEDCFCDETEPQIHEAVVGDWRELTSPEYPVPYCSDLECVYRIVAPSGHHIVLNITDFYTEPYNDVLALFDGVNTTGRHIDVFHGRKRFPYLIRNSNETLSLVFKTDHDVAYDGFRILYTAEPNEDNMPVLKKQLHISTIVIFILSLLLIAATVLAVYRRIPGRFENPVYVPSVSYSDETIDTNASSNLFG